MKSWSLVAIKNFIAIGADAANAFAEAPPPVAPLYVRIDPQYRQWWTQCKKRSSIPSGYGLRVKRALQGHPESPRLWAKLIDRIILELGLTSCTHEPCLYYTSSFGPNNEEVLFLRQVDDFAIAVKNKPTAQTIVQLINSKMTIQITELGVISRFNGMDIFQTKWFVKLSNRTYIKKILSDKQHLLTKPLPNFPTPMHHDAHFQHQLELAEPLTEEELILIEKEFGFKYRQAIGEILYALVTCRLDLSFSLIKLSQYSTRPARIHFEACADLYRYLYHTIDDGIYYWRSSPRHDVPTSSFPIIKQDQIDKQIDISILSQLDPKQLFALVDSDFAADKAHRKSVTGFILKLGGGTIVGKTRFQEIIAQSSTEAEFIAAADAGKMILYTRSILEQVGLPQYEATVIFEDNQGALLMAQAGKPTKKTRHVEIKHFTIQQWTELDLLKFKHIRTSINSSDSFTKATARTLFYRHMDYTMGRKVPEYTINAISDSSDQNLLVSQKTKTSNISESSGHTSTHDSSTLYQSGGG